MIIVHRCTKCRRYDLQARDGTAPCPTCKPGTPEVVPSFTAGGRRIERLAPPGTALGGIGILATCNCAACKTVYEQHMAAVAS
jgi:hypothetical protein